MGSVSSAPPPGKDKVVEMSKPDSFRNHFRNLLEKIQIKVCLECLQEFRFASEGDILRKAVDGLRQRSVLQAFSAFGGW